MIVCYGDHEYSLFDSVSDHSDYGPGSDCELHEADLVVKLDGYRGHYLGRDFIYQAMGILEEKFNPEDFDSDRQILDEYEDHANYLVPPSNSYTVAEAVSEMVGEYESHLFDAGFYVEWNDGVQIVKVGDEIQPIDLSKTPEFAIEEARSDE